MDLAIQAYDSPHTKAFLLLQVRVPPHVLFPFWRVQENSKNDETKNIYTQNISKSILHEFSNGQRVLFCFADRVRLGLMPRDSEDKRTSKKKDKGYGRTRLGDVQMKQPDMEIDRRSMNWNNWTPKIPILTCDLEDLTVTCALIKTNSSESL